MTHAGGLPPKVKATWLAALLAVVVALCPPVAASGAVKKDRVFCAVLLVREFLISTFTGRMDGRCMLLSYGSKRNPSFRLDLGGRLGAGMVASVYRVADLVGGGELQGLSDMRIPMAVKMAHGVRGTGGRLRFPNAGLVAKELELFQELVKGAAAVAAHEAYPKNAAWGRRPPVVPITHAVHSSRGLLLFKQLVRGVSLPELLARYPEGFPPAVMAGLRDIFDFGRALAQVVRVKGLGPFDPSGIDVGRYMEPDMNPSNLTWVEDPAELRLLGMGRPGFVFYELTESKNGYRLAGENAFEAFLNQVYALAASGR